MKILNTAAMAFGYLFLFLGLVWIGQGTGYFPYPKTSPMISQMPWAYRGIGLSLVGAIVIFTAGRLRR